MTTDGPRISKEEADRTRYADVCDKCGGSVEKDRRTYHEKGGHERNYGEAECGSCEAKRKAREREEQRQEVVDKLEDTALSVDRGNLDPGFDT